MSKSDQKLNTVAPDARFQEMNITSWCFTSFVDYHRCLKLMGPKSPCCAQLAKIYKTICPNSWISRWEEQLKLGTFPQDFPPDTCKPKKK